MCNLTGWAQTYDPQSIPALIATLRDLFGLNSATVGLIAATVRNEDTIKLFLQACRGSPTWMQGRALSDSQMRMHSLSETLIFLCRGWRNRPAYSSLTSLRFGSLR